jgi:di/tripeptidase
MYYLCTLPKFKAIAGPFATAGEVAKMVNAQKDPAKFCVMSRYLLAKDGVYPRTARGDATLTADIEFFQTMHKEWKAIEAMGVKIEKATS